MPAPLANRKLLHVSAIIDASLYYDLMLLIDGKAVEVVCRPVKHGGVENGALKSMPTAAEFVIAYAAKHPHFTTREVNAAAAEAIGMKKQSIYSGLNALKEDGVLKKVGSGEWKVTGKPRPSMQRGNRYTAAKKATGRGSGKPRPKVGERHRDHIMKVLKAKGGDVPIKVIKDALLKQKVPTSSISPTLATLLKAKEITRPAEGVYRANG